MLHSVHIYAAGYAIIDTVSIPEGVTNAENRVDNSVLLALFQGDRAGVQGCVGRSKDDRNDSARPCLPGAGTVPVVCGRACPFATGGADCRRIRAAENPYLTETSCFRALFVRQ